MTRWLAAAGAAAVLVYAAGTGLAATPSLALSRPVTREHGLPARAAQARSAGTFARAAYLRTPDYVQSVAIGKVTGNGRRDLVLAGGLGRDDFLWMVPQEASGRLGKPQKITARDFGGNFPLIVTDLYRRGHAQVMIAGGAGILVYTPRHGRLTGPATIRIPTGVSDFAVSDLNHDGHPDIVVSNGLHSSVTIYYGTRSHTFRRGRTLHYPDGGVWYTSVFTAAFRHRGRPGDIAFFDRKTMDVRLRGARGAYGPATRYSIAPIRGQAVADDGSAAVGDLTGDGRPDLVLPNETNSPQAGVEVYADTPSGRLRQPVTYRTLDGPGPMRVADLTGNGRDDLVIQHADWKHVGVMLQLADHRLGREALYRVSNCCSQSSFGQPAVGDLNGDGRPDIAVAAQTAVAILYQKK